MKKFKVLTISIVVCLSLISSVTTFASVYLEETLTGTKSESSSVVLGDGGRYITASGINSKAFATAKKIKKYFPDTNEASITVIGGQWSQEYFTAQSYTDNGIQQSYYIEWVSNDPKSKGIVRFQD